MAKKEEERTTRSATKMAKKSSDGRDLPKMNLFRHMVAYITLGLLCGWYYFLLILYPTMIYLAYFHRSFVAGGVLALFIALTFTPLQHEPQGITMNKKSSLLSSIIRLTISLRSCYRMVHVLISFILHHTADHHSSFLLQNGSCTPGCLVYGEITSTTHTIANQCSMASWT